MKFCQKCGNQIMDEAVICPKCGCATGMQAPQKAGNSGLVTAGLIFAWLMPIVGLIIGLVALSSPEERVKDGGKGVVIVSICAAIFYFCIGMMIGMGGAF